MWYTIFKTEYGKEEVLFDGKATLKVALAHFHQIQLQEDERKILFRGKNIGKLILEEGN